MLLLLLLLPLRLMLPLLLLLLLLFPEFISSENRIPRRNFVIPLDSPAWRGATWRVLFSVKTPGLDSGGPRQCCGLTTQPTREGRNDVTVT